MTAVPRGEEWSEAVHDIILGPGPGYNEPRTGHQNPGDGTAEHKKIAEGNAFAEGTDEALYRPTACF